MVDLSLAGHAGAVSRPSPALKGSCPELFHSGLPSPDFMTSAAGQPSTPLNLRYIRRTSEGLRAGHTQRARPLTFA